MQQSRICIFVFLQEMLFCVQISFVFYCFQLSYFFHKIELL